MPRSLARVFLFLVTFAIGAGALWVLSERVIVASGVGRGSIGLDFADAIAKWKASMLQVRRARRIAFVGDSMLWPPTRAPALPERVAALLNDSVRNYDRVRVRTLQSGGLTLGPEYCLVDEIAAAEPSLVVLELNLRGLRPHPLGPYAYAELGGRIAWPRLLSAAFAPLQDSGLTLNRLLFYRLLTKANLQAPWGSLIDRQARLVTGLESFEGWVETLAGTDSSIRRRFSGAKALLNAAFVEGTPHGTRTNIEVSLGTVLTGLHEDSRLRILELVLDDLRRANVPVLVWVSPVNLEYMRALGIPLEGLAVSMAKIRATVEASGAALADLHALLPDAAFRDPGDHYTVEGEPDGTAMVAAELAKAIRNIRREDPSTGAATSDAVQ